MEKFIWTRSKVRNEIGFLNLRYENSLTYESPFKERADLTNLQVIEGLLNESQELIDAKKMLQTERLALLNIKALILGFAVTPKTQSYFPADMPEKYKYPDHVIPNFAQCSDEGCETSATETHTHCQEYSCGEVMFSQNGKGYDGYCSSSCYYQAGA